MNCKIPEEVWSSVVPSFKNLRIFGCVAYAHINQGKLEPRAMKCLFIGYHERVKGYKLWYTDGKVSKMIISRDVIFRELEMYMVLVGVVEEQFDLAKKVPEHVEVQIPKRSDNQEIEPVQDDDQQEEMPADQETFRNYQLAKDRSRRQIRTPAKYAQADVISFAFNVVRELESIDPLNYKEAMSCKERDKWITVMHEEMDNLKKNKTWILVDKPK